MLLLLIIIPFFIVYSWLVLYYRSAWNDLGSYTPLQDPGTVKMSVIIPARNEETYIVALLEALLGQTYPAEIIVVDDHSTDRTAELVLQFPSVKLIRLQEDGINSYKKKALETGIAAAGGDWIVTTDADCLPSPGWLHHIASFIAEKEPVFIAAPVDISCGNSFVEIFQSMDFMVLQGITGGAVHKKQLSMCNGANLAYEKKAFSAVGGFSGVDHIASGDDMLLMHKIWKQYPDGVHYLKAKDAIVNTSPMRTWKSFFNQRIRWASKATMYTDKRIVAVLLVVYLFNLSFLTLAIAGFFDPYYWIWLGLLWIAKTLVELPLFISLSRFFNKQWAVKWLFFFQPVHIAYTIFSGLFGQFGKYEWKGRTVK